MSKTKGKLYNKKAELIINTILGIYVILTVIPLWYVLNNAFKKPEFIYKAPLILLPETFTFNSIFKVFSVMKYPRLFYNNIVILLISCGLMIILGSSTAYAIEASSSKLLKRIYYYIVLLVTVPFQLVMIPLVSMLQNMRLLDGYLGVSLTFTVVSLPLVVFLYAGYMKTIPSALMEAAIVDGCGIFRTFILIYMPLLKVVTGTVLILRGVFVWNNLLIPLITVTNPYTSTLVLRLYSFASTRVTQWDMVFAGALLVSLPAIIMFLLMQKSFIQGIVSGSVKG